MNNEHDTTHVSTHTTPQKHTQEPQYTPHGTHMVLRTPSQTTCECSEYAGACQHAP